MNTNVFIIIASLVLLPFSIRAQYTIDSMNVYAISYLTTSDIGCNEKCVRALGTDTRSVNNSSKYTVHENKDIIVEFERFMIDWPKYIEKNPNSCCAFKVGADAVYVVDFYVKGVCHSLVLNEMRQAHLDKKDIYDFTDFIPFIDFLKVICPIYDEYGSFFTLDIIAANKPCRCAPIPRK